MPPEPATPSSSAAASSAAHLWTMLNPDPRKRADELARWIRLHQGDSDRALGLGAAGFFEDRLGRVLRKAFVVSSAEVDELLGGEDVADRPLATLAARVNLCMALGIISKAAASQLHLFRRLRARLAQRPEGGGFESDTKCRAIVTGLRWMTGDGLSAPTTDRERVLHAAADLAMYLDTIEKHIKPQTYWPSAYDSIFMDEQTRAREIERVMKMQKGGAGGGKDGGAAGRFWF